MATFLFYFFTDSCLPRHMKRLHLSLIGLSFASLSLPVLCGTAPESSQLPRPEGEVCRATDHLIEEGNVCASTRH